jgi:uncharacterized protein (DUF433 family)
MSISHRRSGNFVSNSIHPYSKRIVVDPAIMVGKPVVKGARMPVELVLKRLSQDLNVDTLLAAYLRLSVEDQG